LLLFFVVLSRGAIRWSPLSLPSPHPLEYETVIY
jgi:hypothetical protein